MTVYGKYSLGSGSFLDVDVWRDFTDKGIIDAYVQSISIDLEKAGIPLDTLKDWHVMDVGTGRDL